MNDHVAIVRGRRGKHRTAKSGARAKRRRERRLKATAPVSQWWDYQ